MSPLDQEERYANSIGYSALVFNGFTFKDVKSSVAKCAFLEVGCIF